MESSPAARSNLDCRTVARVERWPASEPRSATRSRPASPRLPASRSQTRERRFTRGRNSQILDFGLAGLLHASQSMTDLTQAGAVLGSLPTWRPSSCVGRRATHAPTSTRSRTALPDGDRRLPFQKDRPEALMSRSCTQRRNRPLASPRRAAGARPSHRLLLKQESGFAPPVAGVVSQALRGIGEGPRAALPAPARDRHPFPGVLPLQNVSRDPPRSTSPTA